MCCRVLCFLLFVLSSFSGFGAGHAEDGQMVVTDSALVLITQSEATSEATSGQRSIHLQGEWLDPIFCEAESDCAGHQDFTCRIVIPGQGDFVLHEAFSHGQNGENGRAVTLVFDLVGSDSSETVTLRIIEGSNPEEAEDDMGPDTPPPSDDDGKVADRDRGRVYILVISRGH